MEMKIKWCNSDGPGVWGADSVQGKSPVQTIIRRDINNVRFITNIHVTCASIGQVEFKYYKTKHGLDGHDKNSGLNMKKNGQQRGHMHTATT